MTRPRVGFLGTGWIGRQRMAAMIATAAIEPAVICDPSAEMIAEAARLAPGATVAASLDDMLALNLDAVVIASPSALHSEQSLRALAAGTAVFCQKPLGRSAPEVSAVVDAARAADRLLAVDLSYRHASGMISVAEAVRDGRLGHVHAVDLVFHNAYGPDKPWFYDRALSGGGCVIDLGVHLVDLALWVLDFPEVVDVASNLFAGGAPLPSGAAQVEDYAIATLVLAGGTVVRLACSWRLHAGRDAEISARFYGDKAGAGFHNRDGSFYDFTAELYEGTRTRAMMDDPEEWGGRAAAQWARRLSVDARFDRSAHELVEVAAVLDRIYAR